MTFTLLLDLDDTLLENEIMNFLPHYLKALGKQLAGFVSPEKMAKELLAATDHMIRNPYPDMTLEQAFDSQFYPQIGVEKKDIVGILNDFYETRFPELKFLTNPRPAAVDLVKSAFQQGFTVGIATNPLFPMRAIQHRLAWADLPVEKYPFDLVTSYEKFHFAKPNPAFYAECLSQLGWPDQSAVMVGNSLPDDLVPASCLNIPGFWVSSDPDPFPNLPSGGKKGDLGQIMPWLQDNFSALGHPEMESTEAILAVLKSTPAALDSFSRNFSDEMWSGLPQQDEWCFTEIICHLRDSDREIHFPRIERILKEQNAFFSAINADDWSETRRYCEEDGPHALRGFINSRVELIQRLEALTSREWESPARHAIFGPTTLKELISFIAQHDRTHIRQAFQTVRIVKKDLGSFNLLPL
jgi:FMN phosphatase YigB (HAD superfamily)